MLRVGGERNGGDELGEAGGSDDRFPEHRRRGPAARRPVDGARLSAGCELIEQRFGSAAIRLQGGRQARRFHRQRTHVAEIVLIGGGRGAGLRGRQPAARAQLRHQRAEGGRLASAQRRQQQVLRTEIDQHRRPPRGIRAEPVPFLVEAVRRQRESRVGIADLAGAHAADQTLDGLDRLADPCLRLPRCGLRVDQQMVGDPTRLGGRVGARRVARENERVAQRRQSGFFGRPHGRPPCRQHRLFLVAARLQDGQPLPACGCRGAPRQERWSVTVGAEIVGGEADLHLLLFGTPPREGVALERLHEDQFHLRPFRVEHGAIAFRELADAHQKREGCRRQPERVEVGRDVLTLRKPRRQRLQLSDRQSCGCQHRVELGQDGMRGGRRGPELGELGGEEVAPVLQRLKRRVGDIGMREVGLGDQVGIDDGRAARHRVLLAPLRAQARQPPRQHGGYRRNGDRARVRDVADGQRAGQPALGGRAERQRPAHGVARSDRHLQGAGVVAEGRELERRPPR